jgi:hypothetical protein
MAQEPNVIYAEGDEPEAIETTPLEGLETQVLEVWKQTPNVRKAHQRNPVMVETAVRQAVFNPLREEAEHRARGLQPHEAEEFTRPAMWRAPVFPTAKGRERPSIELAGGPASLSETGSVPPSTLPCLLVLPEGRFRD